MNHCKLCSGLAAPIGLDGDNDSHEETDKPKVHAVIHQRQLHMITGQKLSLEEIVEKCFGTFLQENPLQEAHDPEFKWPKVKCPISKVCFQMYEKSGRKGIMACSKCGRNLKFNGHGFRCATVLDHACMHLEKELFECRICQHKSCTQNSMKHHLTNSHKISGNNKNYISHINDHQAVIIATVKSCFAKQIKVEFKQENVVQLPKWKRNHPSVTCPISKVCYEVHKKQGGKRTFECSVCHSSLKVVKSFQVASSRVKNHACIHLDRAMFQCRVCDYKGCTQASIKHHLNVIHKLSGVKANYIDHSSDYEAEIIAMIRRCFEEPMKKPGFRINLKDEPQQFGDIPVMKTHKGCVRPRTQVAKICYEVHQKDGRKDTMECSECGSTFRVMENGHFTSRRVKDHACMHIDQDIFECRFCEYKSPNQSGVKKHLASKHKLGTSSRNFIDHTKKFEEDIIAKIRSCFGERSQAMDPKLKSQARRRAIPFTTPFSTSCRRLLKGKDKNAKVACLVCGKHVSFFNNHNAAVVGHACTHLDKKPCQCKLCEFEVSTKTGLAKHLKNAHQRHYSDDTGKDLSNEMKDKILDMVKCCFGSDQSHSTARSTQGRLTKIYNQLFSHCKYAEKVECIKCRSKISLVGGLRVPLEHARQHLDKPMFKCKICKNMAITRAGIMGHLRRIHEVSQVMTNCEDSTDTFVQELCDMMTACFGNSDNNI